MKSNYEISTVKRSQITLYEKNPRKINEANLKRLKKGLKEFGLVAPLVWNKRTGNLVSGHQRISVIDAENKADYDIQVAVIDVDEKTEARLVVFMNNYDTQGEFDQTKLTDLFLEFDLNPEFEGFDLLSIDYEFDERLQKKVTEQGKGKEYSPEKVEKLKQAKKDAAENLDKKNTSDTFVVIACSSLEQVEEVKKIFNIPEWEKYVSGDTVLARIEKYEQTTKG